MVPKIIAPQYEVTLSYHKMRGISFLAATSAAMVKINTYKTSAIMILLNSHIIYV